MTAKWVPTEMTDEMESVGADHWPVGGKIVPAMRRFWHAVLSAAPTPEPRPDVAGLVERAEAYLRFEMLAEPIDETALIRDLLAALKEGAK